MSDDLESIRQLKARYFRLMDTKDWEGLAGVFTDDVRIDMVNEGGSITVGLDDYMPFLVSQIGTATTVHHGHMPEITLVSTEEATGIWAMEDELWWPEGSPVSYVHGYGHYHESYAKHDGEWRINQMTLTRLHREIRFG
ncbi:NTF2_like domain containing protein [Acidimicrobiia bacterium]